MKNPILILLVLSILLAGCAPGNVLEAVLTSTLTALSGSTITPIVPTWPTQREATSADTETISPTPVAFAEFILPEPEVWVMLMKPVREYLYYRKQAVITGDVQVLWDRYPELQYGVDISRGINSEEFLVYNMKSLKSFDGNIFPEYYDRIKVYLAGGLAEVLVQGVELYLYRDDSQFEDLGGEFKIVLYLISRDNQPWTVYRTDEVTQAEWDLQVPR